VKRDPLHKAGQNLGWRAWVFSAGGIAT
jgi:hypothetical protein